MIVSSKKVRQETAITVTHYNFCVLCLSGHKIWHTVQNVHTVDKHTIQWNGGREDGVSWTPKFWAVE